MPEGNNQFETHSMQRRRALIPSWQDCEQERIEQGIRELHAACRRKSWMESNDSSYTDNPDGVRQVNEEYRRATIRARYLGINIDAELRGKGYLL